VVEAAQRAVEDSRQEVEDSRQAVEDLRQAVEDLRQEVEDLRRAVEAAGIEDRIRRRWEVEVAYIWDLTRHRLEVLRWVVEA